MICQAPTQLLLCATLLAVLAACQSDPFLSHQEVPPRTRAKLDALSRAPTEQEYRDHAFQIDATISGTGAVSVPMTLEQGIPTVRAKVNGRRSIPMIVDTGSQGCIMEARTATAKGVTILKVENAPLRVSGTTGVEEVLFGVPDTVVIDEMQWEKFPFLVRMHETHVRLSRWNLHTFCYDILGMNAVLPRCDYLTFDFPGKRLVFGMAERFTAPTGKRVWKAPLVMRDKLPYVQLRTNGKTWLALLDTGFDGLIHMNEETARSLKLHKEAQPVRILRAGLGLPQNAKQSTEFGQINLSQLDSLGPKMTNIPTLIIPEGSKIGCTLLQPFRVTLDFKRHTLWLEDTSSL